MILFPLTLQKTYYRQGFFNVMVEFDRYVREDEGQVKLNLGDGRLIDGHVNRSANQNGTARIMGGKELRDWFQDNFSVMDTVEVDLRQIQVISLRKPSASLRKNGVNE